MFQVFYGLVTNTEIINDEGERYVAGVVFVQSFRSCLLITVFFQMVLQLFVREDAGLRETVHPLANLNHYVFIAGD